MTIDDKNARIQVSIDADQPLQFEKRVGFPNGDIGKVTLSYEGLDRYCYGCNRISHDIYACTETPEEEKERLIKEYRELNAKTTMTHHGPSRTLGNNRTNNGINNKRPRSPTSEAYRGSPNRSYFPGNSRGDKRTKGSENYWTSRLTRDNGNLVQESEWRRDSKHNRYQHTTQKDNVWSRLDNHTTNRKLVEYNSRNDRRTQVQGTQSSLHRHAPYEARYRKSGQGSPNSQQAWRPKAQTYGEKSNDYSRTATNPNHMETPPTEKADSQQTVSGILPDRNGHNSQGNGVLVVHQNETSAERMRRLKGKAHMVEETQKQTTPSAILLRDRGTVTIREGGTRSTVVSPREEETEVDKLVDEFGDVDMDEDMLENDDLLVDEPGYDEEIIDAISQLSPVNAATRQTKEVVKHHAKVNGKHVEQEAKVNKYSGKEQPKSLTSGRDKKGQGGRQAEEPSGADLKKKG
ncbi:Uncharacterized protein Rs2_28244 [Raphanus sativus]|nr:Uncharacterized protein Rs2_28244 [Raphanus sativus]